MIQYFVRRLGGLPCACLQIDEANVPGNPVDAPLAAAAINRVLDAVKVLGVGRVRYVHPD